MRNKTFLSIFCLFLMFLLITPLFSQTVIRVNCGGSDFRDHNGNEWSRDQKYRSGSWGYIDEGYFLKVDFNIKGTTDDRLYQEEHNALDRYRFDVPNGNYIVVLKFAECYYHKEGERIFHVRIQGRRVLRDFDMVAEAGFATAIDKTYEAEVTDGSLVINFDTIYTAPGVSIAHANVKGIAVIEQGSEDAKLWLNDTALNFRSRSASRSFEIKNGGSRPLEWQCAEDPDLPWITSVNPTSGVLHQGQSQLVDVRISREGLAPGDYEGQVAVTSNGGNGTVKILMDVEKDLPIADTDVSELDFGSILTERQFILRNQGTAALAWSVNLSASFPWITEVIPANGKLNASEAQTVSVKIDRAKKAANDSTLAGNILLQSNGGNLSLEVKAKPGNESLRLNCGGDAFSDIQNNIWQADFAYSGGAAGKTNGAIENTDDDVLYQSVRKGAADYNFAVQENGLYHLNFHFVENEAVIAGVRIFNVVVEDSILIDSLDIFAEAGSNSALTQSGRIALEDKSLNINLVPIVGEPVIAALEILKIPTAPFLYVNPEVLDFTDSLSTMRFTIQNLGIDELIWQIDPSVLDGTPFSMDVTSGTTATDEIDSVVVTFNSADLPDGLYTRTVVIASNGGKKDVTLLARVGAPEPYLQRVNAADKEFVDSRGREWAADQEYVPGAWGYVGGETYRKDVHIKDTDDDRLYQTERWGTFVYKFDVPNGAYQVSLLFAEIYVSAPGKRIMDVSIESEKVIQDFDLFAEYGRRVPVTKTFTTIVKDGQLNIDFSSSVEDAKINAIEVTSVIEAPAMTQAMAVETTPVQRLPETMALLQNFPNPFNMQTVISYQLPVEAEVMLEVFNLLGQKEISLVTGKKSAGTHTIVWEGLNAFNQPVASGVYLYRMTAIPTDHARKPFHTVRKMILVK